jgi:hypothetical protein
MRGKFDYSPYWIHMKSAVCEKLTDMLHMFEKNRMFGSLGFLIAGIQEHSSAMLRDSSYNSFIYYILTNIDFIYTHKS